LFRVKGFSQPRLGFLFLADLVVRGSPLATRLLRKNVEYVGSLVVIVAKNVKIVDTAGRGRG